MDTLVKEIIAKAVGDTVADVLEYKDIDIPEIVKDECVVIANEIHNILHKYGFTDDGRLFGSDFEAIEEIISVFEKHGYSGGSIHDF